MKKSATLILTLFVAALNATAQYRTPKTPDSDWVAKPILHPAPREYAKEPAVVLTQSTKIEYKYEGKGTSIFSTFHRTIKLMDQRGVEAYSTVDIPFYTSAKIEEIKARTISASGKVYDIPRHMFKVSQNAYGAPVVKFAMEGVGKNAEVEVYLKTLLPYNRFGTCYFQYPIPIMDQTFEMAYPKEFIIEQKGFNGFPDAQDTLITGRKHLKIHLKDIPSIKPEPFSFMVPHMMRTEWRISYWADDYGDQKRLFTWDEFAKEFYHNVFNLPDGVTPEEYWLTPKGHDIYRGDTERRAVNNFLTSIGVTGSELELDKILKIERGIKNNIMLYPATEDHSGRLDTIISRRSATIYGYMKLFAACFAQSDVKCEIGSTTNHKYHLFNNSFENWNNLYDYLIYFPNQKAYLSPTNVLGNTAVFCKMSTPSEFRARVADVRIVPPNVAADNYTNIKADVTFKGMVPNLDITYAYGGLDAVPLRDHFATILNPNQQREYVEGVVAGVENPSDLLEYVSGNENVDNYSSKQPFQLTAKVRASKLMGKAGGRMLFKIGDILGPQKELYETKERKLPVDLDYPHSLNRIITVTLPSGYRVLNPQALKTKLDFYDAENKKIPACSFVSNYTLKGNKLTVTISEIYSQIHYHLADYATFRKVINAAADFNKVALVLGH